MPLKKLHDEAKHLGFQVSWAKTKVQVFGGLLEKVQFAYACGKDIEISEKFTYLVSVAHNDDGLSLKVMWQIGLVYCVMNSLNTNIWHC